MLTAFYDLAVSPPTFDALGFLATAERKRIELGEPSLRIVIVPGPDNGFRKDNLPPRDPKIRMRMLKKVVFKLCKLLPSVEEVVHCETRADAVAFKTGHVFPAGYDETRPVMSYGTKFITDAIRAGCLPFRADQPVTKNDRLIAITLREARYWPSRNSNLPEWQKVGRHFMQKGYDVVFVRDTEFATKAMPGFRTDPDAAISLQSRLALYETARLNLFVNNGPTALAMLSRNVALLNSKMETADAPCTQAAYFAAHGMPRGEQLPRPDCHILWADDVAELLIPAAEAMLDGTAAAAPLTRVA